jgi:hypothetical protein
MKKKSFFVFVMIVLAVIMISGCTKAERDTWTRRKAAENGQIMRHIVVRNSRSDRLIWANTGTMNLENSSNGDYEIIIWSDNGEITRELFNGRDNYIHVHDMTQAEINEYKRFAVKGAVND